MEVEIAKENEKLLAVEALISSYKTELDGLNNSKIIATNKIEVISREIQNIENLENAAGASKEGANEAIAKRQSRFNELKEEREKFSKQLTEIRVNIASITSEIMGTTQELERLDAQLTDSERKQEIAQVEFEHNTKSVEDAEDLVAWQIENATNAEAKQKLENLKKNKNNLMKTKLACNKVLKNLKKKELSLWQKLTRLTRKNLTRNLKLARSTQISTQCKTKFWKNTNLIIMRVWLFAMRNSILTKVLRKLRELKKKFLVLVISTLPQLKIRRF